MNKKIFRSIIILGLSSIIGYLVTFYLTYYITSKLGIEAYGFVSIAKTFVNYGNIATVALTSFIIRYIIVHYHRDELKEACSYYTSSINACLVLCLGLLLIFIILVINLEDIIKIPKELINSVKLLFVTVGITFVVTTMTTPFSIGFYVRNRLDISGIIKILSYAIEIIVLISLFSFLDAKLWFVGIGSMFASFVILLGTAVFNHKLVKNLQYRKELFDLAKVKTLLSNGLWNSINQLGNSLNSGLDLLISNALLTGVQTGQIAVAKSIGIIFGTLSNIIFQPLQPALLKKFSSGDSDSFLDQLKQSMCICGFIGSLAFAGFTALGKLFYTLWLPNEDMRVLYLLTILTIFTYIMDIFLQPIYYVNTLTVKNRIPCFVTILGGIANVIGMYVLIKYTSLSLYAVPLTTLVIMFIINFVFNPMYASWCLGISKRYFYELVLRHLFATVLMVVIFCGINIIIKPKDWLTLFLCVIIMTSVGILVYFPITLSIKKVRTITSRFVIGLNRCKK